MDIEIKKAIAILEKEGFEIIKYTKDSVLMLMTISEDARKRKIIVCDGKLKALDKLFFVFSDGYRSLRVSVEKKV